MKKIDYEYIDNVFKREGYTLLSKQYINSKQYLDFICPNGHKHKITWDNWNHGRRCGVCHYVTHKQVKQSFEKEGYVLLTKEYNNAHQNLNFICPNGHEYKINWNKWSNGIRCGVCHYVTHKQVKQSFEKEGYVLLTKRYISSNKLLEFICPNGHKYKMTWNNWQQGRRCKECSYINNSSKQEKEITNYLKNNYFGQIEENDRTLIQNPKTGQFLELDIWLPEINKAIEYNGKYWHGNKYQQWKDHYKQQWCKENGIDLLVIEDEQWRKNKDFNLINNFIEGK